MVVKRVSMKKTDTGYSIKVFVADGEVAAALRRGIDLFFEKLAYQSLPEKQQRIVEEVKYEEEKLKESSVVKEA